jgi:catechol 2,3-dioxygenase-like lactoylglutathione lyase family enzyme
MRTLVFTAATLAAFVSMCSPTRAETTPPVFGYVGLYVKDVSRSVEFYERAFGLTRRFITKEQEYGEMQTGTTRLGFMNAEMVERVSKNSAFGDSGKPPTGSEIGFVTTDVAGLYNRAVAAGATAVLPPSDKPWHQTVSYVRDPDGHLVEICSPLP